MQVTGTNDTYNLVAAITNGRGLRANQSSSQSQHVSESRINIPQPQSNGGITLASHSWQFFNHYFIICKITLLISWENDGFTNTIVFIAVMPNINVNKMTSSIKMNIKSGSSQHPYNRWSSRSDVERSFNFCVVLADILGSSWSTTISCWLSCIDLASKIFWSTWNLINHFGNRFWI